MPTRRTRNFPRKTPWDKPRKKKPSISQDIRDVREWLMVTYGGRWGSLQLAADGAEKMETEMAKLEDTNKDLREKNRGLRITIKEMRAEKLA